MANSKMLFAALCGSLIFALSLFVGEPKLLAVTLLVAFYSSIFVIKGKGLFNFVFIAWILLIVHACTQNAYITTAILGALIAKGFSGYAHKTGMLIFFAGTSLYLLNSNDYLLAGIILGTVFFSDDFYQ